MVSAFRHFLPAPHHPTCSVLCSLAALGLFSEVTQAATPPPGPQDSTTPAPQVEQPPKTERIVVTASRRNLTGRAATASEGSITGTELRLRPAYRIGQLLEAVPGLVVTSHSGEGKANQFLLRGFNLDHGTDLASFVDDMPINGVSNAHGQGYTDLNFLIPETLSGVDYTKGPFHANIGDFGVAGSDHMKLASEIPREITLSAGTLGDYRAYAGGTVQMANGDRWVNAGALSHADGPWRYPDNARAIRAMSRYTHGSERKGFDITGMFYRGQWRATNDQPLEAIQNGMIDRFGSLDPTDGGFSERYSLSAHQHMSGENWNWVNNAFVVHDRLTLWNNFTHYLDDPVHGDQQAQDETRTTLGGSSAYTRHDRLATFLSDTTVGVQGRYDFLYVDRRHTEQRRPLPDCTSSTGYYVCNADSISLGAVGMYIQNTLHWTPWFRTVIGLREDYQGGVDHNLVDGSATHAGQWLFQPKGSLIFGPWKKSELYLSAGKGYHSNDFRSVSGSYSVDKFAAGSVSVPLMTEAISGEVGIRSTPLTHLNVQVAAFIIDFASELSYDGDAGVTSPGPASRRQGVEFSAQYNPLPWIELNTDLSFAKARYRTNDPQAYGIDGVYVSNAPDFVWSFGLLVDTHKHWYGGLQVRWLGHYALVEDNSLRSSGYKEVNINAGYRFTPRLKLEVSIFNLTNSHAFAAQYAYDYRLTPNAAVSTGATGHALEPTSARLAVTAGF